MNLFPAQIGTFILERDPSSNPPIARRLPVIGWMHVQGSIAFPVAVMSHGGLTHGKAILHSEGYVTDPTHGLTFETEAEWMAFMRTAKPKAPPAAQSEPDNRSDAMPDTPEPRKPAARPSPPAGTTEPTVTMIQFGTKTFKTNSFWSMPEVGGIFQIEGEQPYPKDDRCTKVTRDEYAALKKAGAVVIDPHKGYEEDAAAEIGDDATIGLDEDDAMDLV